MTNLLIAPRVHDQGGWDHTHLTGMLHIYPEASKLDRIRSRRAKEGKWRSILEMPTEATRAFHTPIPSDSWTFGSDRSPSLRSLGLIPTYGNFPINSSNLSIFSVVSVLLYVGWVAITYSFHFFPDQFWCLSVHLLGLCLQPFSDLYCCPHPLNLSMWLLLINKF